MHLPEFKLLRPRTVQEAFWLLAEHGADLQIVAGGTDLIPSLRQQLFAPRYLMDIRGIGELRGIRRLAGEGTAIGALTTLTEIEHSEHIRRDYGVLAEAARAVGSPVLRNMGTIGGNICLNTRCVWYNQSLAWRKSCGFCIRAPRPVNLEQAPGPKQNAGELCHVAPGGTRCWAAFCGDTPPALLCLRAQVEIADREGLRSVPLSEFYTNTGDRHTLLAKNELITRVLLPESTAGCRGAYRKLRRRSSIDYPAAGVAVVVRCRHGKIGGSHIVESGRAAITALNPAPLLVKGAEQALTGQGLNQELAQAVAELAARAAKPLSNLALTPEYRREMIRVLTKRAVMAVASD